MNVQQTVQETKLQKLLDHRYGWDLQYCLKVNLRLMMGYAATNIFIQGSEEQGQLASEVRFLWEQNQTLKEQLSQGSRDKHKENDKLREALARRTAKLEQSRAEGEALRQERGRLQDRLELSTQEHAQLQDALHSSREELHRYTSSS
ncbi:CDK5 regulatory subunit-associated protein 2 [Merluccius polli]|uniref:CDK5 regulatory subunit-associated protein 2 n=1 Tax=Merluccius polli TaxID=89951 RepID=A0AA47NNX7_MERPO|nr:CDK5 regulatory subunit-associated protein 2 [Merluccius polli]